MLVQLQSALSIEGYMEGSDGDPAFIHDPSLTTSGWQNSMLPAVVLGRSTGGISGIEDLVAGGTYSQSRGALARLFSHQISEVEVVQLIANH